MKKVISKNKTILSLFFLYFIIRLVNLTKLPIFNDEAIYLDWSWRELHVSGHLFFSLSDGKPPLLTWFFGLSRMIFANPLFAGRFVSVIAGFFTMLGLYKIGSLWNKKIAVISAVFYLFCPIFSFFDRQALMESAVGAAGIWSLYVILRINEKEQKNENLSVFLGIILGIGYFIKTSALIFVANTIILLGISKKWKVILTMLILFGITTSLLYLQPDFWSTLSSNDRYSLTISELIRFPFDIWIGNLLGNLQIMFFFLSPVLFLSGIAGVFILIKKRKEKNNLIVVLWFLISFFLQVFLVRNTSQRYLVSFLPLLCIFAAVLVIFLIENYKKIGFLVLSIMLIFEAIPAVSEIVKPENYILFMNKITPYSQLEYVLGNTSGYPVLQVMDFLENKAKNEPVNASFAENAGNPESAMNVYFVRQTNITPIYMDGRTFGDELSKYDCISAAGRTTYFISRGNFLSGLNRFLELEKKIGTGNGDFIGIFRLKNNCNPNRTANMEIQQTD